MITMPTDIYQIFKLALKPWAEFKKLKKQTKGEAVEAYVVISFINFLFAFAAYVITGGVQNIPEFGIVIKITLFTPIIVAVFPFIAGYLMIMALHYFGQRLGKRNGSFAQMLFAYAVSLYVGLITGVLMILFGMGFVPFVIVGLAGLLLSIWLIVTICYAAKYNYNLSHKRALLLIFIFWVMLAVLGTVQNNLILPLSGTTIIIN